MDRYRFSDAEFSFMESSLIPFAIYQFIDKRVTTLVLSQGFCDIFGFDDRAEAYELMDNDMYRDAHPDDVGRISDEAIRFATEGGRYEAIYRNKNPKKSEYTIVHAQGEHITMPDGTRLAQVWYTDEGTYIDNETSHEMDLNLALRNALHDESVLKASYYDHLTGLPSMTRFFELAGEKKDEMLKWNKHPCMLFLDLSGMKYYNRKFGFSEGDKLLQAFARVISDYFGSENCSRLGQDHFAVVADDADIEKKLNELFEHCRELNGGVTLPVHVGIFMYRMEEVGPSTACDRAKLACDALKGRYASDFKYYDMSMMYAEENRQYIISNLDRALEEHWIEVYYQPIVRAVNGKVCDEEALSRWVDPVKGIIPPIDFIPILEEAQLVNKIDLYVVDRVIEKIRTQKEAGLHVVPQSINLSRIDFDACDIVEEIAKKVDVSGLSRSLFTIEITESVIGQDFEFMKEQVIRFKSLGFSVWMDDFGSGYSSLDVLQSVPFDLIKFDMHFMQQFNDGDEGKIILTEMMKMASSLGIDTVCEGVETEDQARFLLEIGCSKLQGYYFTKPIPLSAILERYEKGVQIGFEDPEESWYYETIGRVNLHDLSVVIQSSDDEFQKFFDNIPMGIFEFREGMLSVPRINRSFKEYLKRYYDYELTNTEIPYDKVVTRHSVGREFDKAVKRTMEDGKASFVNDRLPDGSMAHYFVRRIAENPNNGKRAVALAVLAVTDVKNGITYENIAKALAADYFNIFYVNLETEDFIEYTSDIGEETVTVERWGNNFFEQTRHDAPSVLYHEDVAGFVAAFTKENVLKEIEENGSFMARYRVMKDIVPVYVNMKSLRMEGDTKHIIFGVNHVDVLVNKKEIEDRISQTQIIYKRIMALLGNYIAIYTVDVNTDRYFEYNATTDYEELGLKKHGEDFFASAVRDSEDVIVPGDQPGFISAFTKEKVIGEIDKKGSFDIYYHIMLEEAPVSVRLHAVRVEEKEGDKLIVGVSRMDR
ncbi:MAG: EAL domain-containing protein [Lachnospiraceae bacterium]|nr:EAL domain-containing protein [Lachnospiraceae bacterium]